MAELIEYLDNDKSAYHAVSFCESELIKANFEMLDMTKKFNLSPKGKYYVKPQPSALFAFVMPEDVKAMRIGMAHTDFPTFKLKPIAELGDKANCCLVNVEPYGGSLKKTWFDRPLGIAGIVYVKSDDVTNPREVLFDSELPWLTIPSLAPHMDREIEKKEVDPQKEMNPIVALVNATDKTLLDMVAEKIGVKRSEILSYDLSLYDVSKATAVGMEQEFIQAGKIDNMASCAALINGIIKVSDNKNLSMVALFDNEEIGSRTCKGADSNLLKWVIEKILSANKEADDISILSNSILYSCDGAHAVHPGYVEKADTSSTAFLGKGIVIKTSASQRYVTDPKTIAIIKGICEENNISYQLQANKSGTPGGQTLGPIASSYIPTAAVDMGVPMLAMHSIRELIASKDYDEFEKLISVLLNNY